MILCLTPKALKSISYFKYNNLFVVELAVKKKNVSPTDIIFLPF